MISMPVEIFNNFTPFRLLWQPHDTFSLTIKDIKEKLDVFVFTVSVFHDDESQNALNIHSTDACQPFWNNAVTLQHRSHLSQYQCAKEMSNHPSFCFCYIYFFLSPEIWILVIGLSWREESVTVCCKCDTQYLTGNTATHTVCYQAVVLFVYIAMSYDEVWVVFWKWFSDIHISPHYCPRLGTLSEIIERRLITAGQRKTEALNICCFVLYSLYLIL